MGFCETWNEKKIVILLVSSPEALVRFNIYFLVYS